MRHQTLEAGGDKDGRSSTRTVSDAKVRIGIDKYYVEGVERLCVMPSPGTLPGVTVSDDQSCQEALVGKCPIVAQKTEPGSVWSLREPQTWGSRLRVVPGSRMRKRKRVASPAQIFKTSSVEPEIHVPEYKNGQGEVWDE